MKEGSVPFASLTGASRLLPCPFCGGVAEHDALMIGQAGKDNATPHGHFVECQTCDANSGMEDTPQAAADKWNKRTPAAPAAPEASSPEGSR